MKRINVWLTHWFSSAYHIINLIKDDKEFDFHVTGGAADENCVYRAVCDEWVTEPLINRAGEYIDYCLDVCRSHKIDIFIPRKFTRDISARLSEFDAIGARVLVERDSSLMDIFCDKVKTYNTLAQDGFINIPPYAAVSGVNEYKDAYAALKTPDNRVCVKFAVDEGAMSFRVIDDSLGQGLSKSVGAKITYAQSLDILSNTKDFRPLIVMPYLPGLEVSVDCLYMPHGNHIIIPRFKSQGRSETIRYDDEIIKTCGLFLDRYKLNRPCNLQFIYDNNTPYLLEINTRMSGGVQLTHAATGVNIPNIAVNGLLGVMKEVEYTLERCVVSFVETSVKLK